MSDKRLGTHDHDRNVAGMTYVYPVVSRRAGGVSIGINLNVNNACNWRCIYCQVPNLTRGGPPPIDLACLESELRHMLEAILEGDFMTRMVPEDMRRLHDIALSGNGEPTSAKEFPAVLGIVGKLIREYALMGRIKLVLISNGSLVDRPHVQQGLRLLSDLGGEVWFKLDRATAAGLRAVNGTATTPERVKHRLLRCAATCPTWIQTCVFAAHGLPPDPAELDAYLGFLRQIMADGGSLQGVLLYGLARPPGQAGSDHLTRLPAEWLDAFAQRIEQLGLPCQQFT